MHSQHPGPENVLVISFGVDPTADNNAYLALTDLKELDSQHRIKLMGGAVVARGADGRVQVDAQIGPDPMDGETVSAGLIGLLLGSLGGPLGALPGGATGVLVGGAFDVEDANATASVLGDMSKQLRVERTALLARVIEPSPHVVDAAMGCLGGVVLRRPLADVEREIAAAQDVQRVADRAARRSWRRHQQTQRVALVERRRSQVGLQNM